LTTHGDLIHGLRVSVDAVLAQGDFEPISLVALSTTLATNALVEGHGRRVALILIGYSEQQMQRARLADALGNDSHTFIDGGHRSDGQPISALDTKTLKLFVESNMNSVDAFAVSSMFSVRNPEHEQQAQALIETLCELPVSCGHTLSSGLDAPRRALTTLLNARLIPLIGQLLDAASELLVERKINAPLMIVKGDGSLIHADVARRAPVTKSWFQIWGGLRPISLCLRTVYQGLIQTALLLGDGVRWFKLLQCGPSDLVVTVKLVLIVKPVILL